MADFNWKALLGVAAPGLATALGGPLAGMATKAILGALGLSEGATEANIAVAMANATPADLLALKKADQEFAVQMKELEVDLERISAGDRDSARKMQSSTRSFVPAFLAISVSLGFFGILGYMLVVGIKKDMAGGDALLLMLGSLGTAWIMVMSFYFGTTLGSSRKDETISALSR